MQVIFIHHSCFLVEVDEKVLLFDWFGGDSVEGFHFGGVVPEYEPDTPIYVFASHAHRDHFDPSALSWAERYGNIRYILSKDCKPVARDFLKSEGSADRGIKDASDKRITYVSPMGQASVGDVHIETLRSTDAGVAFYVETRGASFFHAGDLGNWRWEGAGDLVNGSMDANYRSQVQKLAKKKINLAFVPMDPRLGENQFLGIDYFLRHTDAEYVFPMHMWRDYSGIREYKKRLSSDAMADRVVEIACENQVFDIMEE